MKSKYLAGLPALVMCAVLSASCANPTAKQSDGAEFMPTSSATGVLIADQANDAQLILDIHYPDRVGNYPLIVFFHGAMCSPSGYSELADYWASRGYVVIMPAHPQFGKRGRPDSQRALEVFIAQIAEMSAIVDSLDAIAEQVEPLQGRIDATRIAASGHSMGALVSSAVAGLTRTDVNGEPRNYKDDRFDVAVLLSGPGPLPNTPEGAWDSLTIPTLATTGTKDHANRGGEGATWTWRLGTFELTPPGDKYALVVDEADHFLGGVLCSERGSGKPDLEAFEIVASTSTNFLDAYLKQDVAARESLNNELVSSMTAGRAELRIR
jgi:dienelactone hydrolase